MPRHQPRRAKNNAIGHRPLGLLLLLVAVVFPLSLAFGFGPSLFGLMGAPSGDGEAATTPPADPRPETAAESAPTEIVPHQRQRAASTQPESGADQQPAPVCQPGQEPRFEGRFADLRDRLGETVGEPLECAHRHPESGDVLQVTTRGLAVQHLTSGTVRFTDGWRHWALTSEGIVAWEGPSSDPPAERSTQQADPRRPSTPSGEAPNALQEQPPVTTGEEASNVEASGAEEDGSGPKVYVVQPGDRLKDIAARFGIGLWELAGANGIDNPDRLRVGQELAVPALDAQASSAE